MWLQHKVNIHPDQPVCSADAQTFPPDSCSLCWWQTHECWADVVTGEREHEIYLEKRKTVICRGRGFTHQLHLVSPASPAAYPLISRSIRSPVLPVRCVGWALACSRCPKKKKAWAPAWCTPTWWSTASSFFLASVDQPASTDLPGLLLSALRLRTIFSVSPLLELHHPFINIDFLVFYF